MIRHAIRLPPPVYLPHIVSFPAYATGIRYDDSKHDDFPASTSRTLPEYFYHISWSATAEDSASGKSHLCAAERNAVLACAVADFSIFPLQSFQQADFTFARR